METKNMFFGAGIFVFVFASIVLSLSFASAEVLISNIHAPTNVNENQSSFDFDFTLTYVGNSTVDFSFDGSGTSLSGIAVSIPDITNMDGVNNESRVINGTVSGIDSNDGGKTLAVTINAVASNAEEGTANFNVNIINIPASICEAGEVGDLRIKNLNLNNLGVGDDEEWEPLDEIEIEIEIENINDDDDVRDVQIEIIIRNSNGQDVTSDFDLEDDKIDLGRINNDDYEIATFRIPEVPADIDEGDYRLYFKAYEDNHEDEQCTSVSETEFNNDEYHEIEFRRDESQAVIVRSKDISQKIVVSCGSDDSLISFPVYNIGQDKEKNILVRLTNSELGIDEFVLVDNLRSGKKKVVDFFIDIPGSLSKDKHKLNIVNYYDYDSGEDKYLVGSYDRNSEDDLDENYYINLDVIGCGGSSNVGPSISAELTSDAELESELSIRVSVKNNNVEDAEFSYSLSGVSSWAEIVSINPQSSLIKSGETEEIIVKLLPTKSGTHQFKIDMISNGEIYSQQLSVSIPGGETAKGTFLDSLGLGDNVAYWIIGITAVLILIILLLIVKISGRPRRREKAEF